ADVPAGVLPGASPAAVSLEGASLDGASLDGASLDGASVVSVGRGVGGEMLVDDGLRLDYAEVDDDRTVITAQDRVLVAACDSAMVARTAVDAGRVNGFRVVVETQAAPALRRIQQLSPAAVLV